MNHNIKSQLLHSMDDSYVNLTTVVVPIDKHYNELTFRDIKNALNDLIYTVEEEVRLRMDYREYDCTGQHYTTYLDLLDRKLYRDDSKTLLIGIYKHGIGIDC